MAIGRSGKSKSFDAQGFTEKTYNWFDDGRICNGIKTGVISSHLRKVEIIRVIKNIYILVEHVKPAVQLFSLLTVRAVSA